LHALCPPSLNCCVVTSLPYLPYLRDEKEGTSNVIVPAGRDSVELIAAATDVDTTLTSKEIKRGYAHQAISEPPEQVQLGHVVNVESLPTLQDEQEWLLQLKNSLVDAGSVTSSNSAFAAASSTTNSSSNATTSARRASTAELAKSNSYVNPLTAAANAATVTVINMKYYMLYM
jgi:hypothetical protein